MKAKLDFDIHNIRECGLPDVLLSGIFRVPITKIDVFSIERWNGLQTIATSFTLEIPFKNHIHNRRVQLFHPFGVYPFDDFKVQAIKDRERAGWKGFILSSKATEKEIGIVTDNFLMYPVQGTSAAHEYYKQCIKLKEMMVDVKDKFSKTFIGRTCLVQVVDSGSKDHTGVKRNFPLNQFLSEEAGKEIFKAYKENLTNDFTLSSIGAGISYMGYGGSK